MDSARLENCRAYWLGWAPAADRRDDDLTLFRSGLPDARDITEWAAAYAPSFHIPAEAVGPVAAAEAAMPDLVRFEARLDGRIVGTSALLAHAGIAGVYTVTVAEAYRRRGLGAAVTAAALAAGRERGLTTGTLQATSRAGRRVYERMGFETVGTYRMLRPH